MLSTALLLQPCSSLARAVTISALLHSALRTSILPTLRSVRYSTWLAEHVSLSYPQARAPPRCLSPGNLSYGLPSTLVYLELAQLPPPTHHLPTKHRRHQPHPSSSASKHPSYPSSHPSSPHDPQEHRQVLLNRTPPNTVIIMDARRLHQLSLPLGHRPPFDPEGDRRAPQQARAPVEHTARV
ncbi:hypothetical protein DL93DRAFT_499242 [Clavulina sp. PMI_390]|nr:hypothetical protein DL93DRAFT_499242 [Clavulina sp. PMI_390]